METKHVSINTETKKKTKTKKRKEAEKRRNNGGKSVKNGKKKIKKKTGEKTNGLIKEGRNWALHVEVPEMYGRK